MTEQVTFTFKRTHLWGAGGLVSGLAVGLVLGVVLRSSSQRGADAPAGAPPVAAAAGPAAPAPAPARIDVSDRPFKGSADAKVTVVEFMDYQCPFCRRHVDSTLAPLLAQYGGRIRYVVMNYPIPDLHPGAMPFAEAAECANAQGRFWEMHDRLIHADTWDAASLRKQAGAAGLDKARFASCMNDGAMRDVVRRHLDLGASLGINGTPVFFINGQKLEGAVPVGAFAQMIDQALAAPSP